MRVRPVYKVTVFAPPDAVANLLCELVQVSALQYGPYTEVAWQSSLGTEQFRPGPEAIPARGKCGELFRGECVQLIVTIPRTTTVLDAALEMLKQKHPWEEPVILVEEALAAMGRSLASD